MIVMLLETAKVEFKHISLQAMFVKVIKYNGYHKYVDLL